VTRTKMVSTIARIRRSPVHTEPLVRADRAPSHVSQSTEVEEAVVMSLS
jgi:hypothetical protein